MTLSHFDIQHQRTVSQHSHAKRINHIWTIASYVHNGLVVIEVRNNKTGLSQKCADYSGIGVYLYDQPEQVPAYVKKEVNKMAHQIDVLLK